jgi:iron complex outermembrane receptor protein
MRTAVVATAICLSIVGIASADEARAAVRKTTHIQAEGLGPALTTLAKEFDFQVLYRTETVGQLRTQGVAGLMTATEALEHVLNGTGLTYRYLDDKTVTILPVGAVFSEEQSGTLQATSGDPAAKEGKKNSSEGFRLAQVDQGTNSQSSTVEHNPSAPLDSSKITLTEVVVTARRRAENSQTVPVSVTAYSGRDLAERHISNQVDLATNTPSLIANVSGFPQDIGGFIIRGQGPAFNGTSGTVTYFAEAPNGPGGFDGRPGTYYDLANIQVLKGPQGTLFGKNATGGNVLFEPQRPTDSFGGYAQVQLGNYNDKEAEGAINIPLVEDKVLVRIAGAFERRDGYTKDVGPYFPGKDYDNLSYDTFRVGLTLRPLAGLESYTLFRYYRSINNGPGTVPVTLDHNRPDLDGYLPTREAEFSAQQARGVRQVSYDLNEFDVGYYRQLLNDTTYRITPELTLKNIVSYSRNYISYAYDYDASPLPLTGQTSPHRPTEDIDYFTEELQLQGTALDRTLKYQLGAFIDAQTNGQPSQVLFVSFPITTLLGQLIPAQATETNRSHAVFAQATYDFAEAAPALKGLSVTAGYRHTWDYTRSSTQIFAPPATSGSGRFHYGSYTVDVDYKVSPTTFVYATFRDAFKAGGFNSQVPASSPLFSYPPEELQDQEYGVKSTFTLADMTVRTNLDAFFGDYTNIQRTIPANVSGVLGQIVQSAAAGKINGVEFEGTLVPFAGFELSASYSYLDSRYSKTDQSAQRILLGAPFPYTPRNKYSIDARYRLPLASDIGSVTVAATYSHQDKQSIAQSNAVGVPYIPGYGLLNLRLDWEKIYGKPLALSFYVTNATDKSYAVGEFDSLIGGYGFATETFGPPRMFGVQLRYSFGG